MPRGPPAGLAIITAVVVMLGDCVGWHPCKCRSSNQRQRVNIYHRRSSTSRATPELLSHDDFGVIRLHVVIASSDDSKLSTVRLIASVVVYNTCRNNSAVLSLQRDRINRISSISKPQLTGQRPSSTETIPLRRSTAGIMRHRHEGKGMRESKIEWGKNEAQNQNST